MSNLAVPKKRKARKNAGFTLIEIMIVLAIVGLLFSFVGVNVLNQFRKSKAEGAKIQIASFEQGLQAYYLAHNMYPHTSQGLEALIRKPSVGRVPENYPDGGYLTKKNSRRIHGDNRIDMNAKTIRILRSSRMVQTVRLGPKTTFGRSKNRARAGFTLVEILIVLAIVAMVMSLGLPAISRITYQKINSTTRKFVGLIRTVRNDSVLLNNIYRIAFDLDKNTWWVEQQRVLQALDAPQQRGSIKGGDEPPPSNFIFAEKYSKKPTPMPEGVSFVGILKEDQGLQKQGIAYIHFFPNGFNEQAILYIARTGDPPGKGYSIVVRPTSGRVEISPGFVQNLDQPL